MADTIFQSTHPVRGATTLDDNGNIVEAISIHAPRAGCDPSLKATRAIPAKFQSTHPVRGATIVAFERFQVVSISIHAPRAGCDTVAAAHSARCGNFNPRTPCGVRPSFALPARQTWSFQSTHPVRGATHEQHTRCFPRVFQSTHPVRGATVSRNAVQLCSLISIHAPRAGCDQTGCI